MRLALLLTAAFATMAANALELVAPPVVSATAPATLVWPQDLPAARLTVELTDPRGDVVQLTADVAGRPSFSLPKLPPGAYQLRATLDGADGPLARGSWPLLVARPPVTGPPARQLVHWAAALREATPPRVALLTADSDTLLGPLLAQQLGRELALSRPDVSPGEWRDWLADRASDLVIVDAALADDELLDLARAQRSDLVFLGPYPTIAAPAAWAAAARQAAELTERWRDRAAVVETVSALWPDVNDPSRLEEGLRRLVGTDGDWRPEGERRLAEAIADQLTAQAPVPPAIELTGAWRWDGPERGTLRLELSSRLSSDERARVELLSPVTRLPVGDLEVTVPAGGTARIEREVVVGDDPAAVNPLNAGDLVAAIYGSRSSRLARVRLEPIGVGARFEPGTYLLDGAKRLPLRLTQRGGLPRQGLVIGRPGLPNVAFRLGHDASVEVPVPIDLTADGVGRTLLSAEVETGDVPAFAAAVAQYSAAVNLPELAATIDGRLDEWLSATWHAIGLDSQVIAGGEQWTGAADASLRWTAATDGDALAMAMVWADDQPTDADRLELWLARAGGAEPGPVGRWLIGPADPALTVRRQQVGDERLLEVRLPWSAVGGRPEAGELVGFELRLRDADADGVSELTYTGRGSDGTEPDQLGLLHYHGGTIRPPIRLWIDAAGRDRRPGGA